MARKCIVGANIANEAKVVADEVLLLFRSHFMRPYTSPTFGRRLKADAAFSSANQLAIQRAWALECQKVWAHHGSDFCGAVRENFSFGLHPSSFCFRNR